mmetsp:Transcript_64839/g.89043  ORF Transcript_64839/g.89043 Transcript_64839/m.89043 type:complete len:200 (+) Transcript_64839:1371-1970(+)
MRHSGSLTTFPTASLLMLSFLSKPSMMSSSPQAAVSPRTTSVCMLWTQCSPSVSFSLSASFEAVILTTLASRFTREPTTTSTSQETVSESSDMLAMRSSRIFCACALVSREPAAVARGDEMSDHLRPSRATAPWAALRGASPHVPGITMVTERGGGDFLFFAALRRTSTRTIANASSGSTCVAPDLFVEGSSRHRVDPL